MQINFCFQPNDKTVQDYLAVGEVSAVVWQTSEEYTFEFHFGHETGNPVYIRPKRNEDQSNLPKIDTKNKVKFQYKSIDKISNGLKLKQQLSPKAQTDIINVLQNSWDKFQLL